MKKLIIATAIVAASTASFAMANNVVSAAKFGFDKPFIAVTAGTNTNDSYAFNKLASFVRSSDIQADFPGLGSNHSVHGVIGGLQAGANLYTINSQIALGAELDANYSFKKPNFKLTDSDFTEDEKVTMTRYSIDPMAYVAYSPISQITIKAKAGYGYQHLSAKESGADLISQSFEIPTETKIHAWKPVLAAEAAYNFNSNIAAFVGDSYTFGKDWNSLQSLESITSTNKAMPRENVVYAGLKYTF
jgi:opacity protein-like surface antigen